MKPPSKEEFLPNRNFNVYALPVEYKQNKNNISIKFDILNDYLIEFDENLTNPDQNTFEGRSIYYSMAISIKKRNAWKRLIKESLESQEWLEINLTPITKNKNKQIEATVTYCASPVEIEVYKLTGVKKTGKTIKPIVLPDEIYSSKSPKRAWKIILERMMQARHASNIEIKAIGQGQQIRFTNPNGSYFCFDIGFTTRHKSDQSIHVKNFNHDYSDLDFVLLSHWDEDHYIGALHANTTKPIEVEWIAPSTMISRNSQRLALAIHKKNANRIVLIDPSDCWYLSLLGCILSRNIFFQIYFHNGSTKDTNDSGIGVFAKIKGKSILITGDAGYSHLPSEISYYCRNGVDYLIAAHHGAAVDGEPPKSKAGGVAIISVGKNKYKHPVKKTLKNLKRKRGFKIFRTDQRGDLKI